MPERPVGYTKPSTPALITYPWHEVAEAVSLRRVTHPEALPICIVVVDSELRQLTPAVLLSLLLPLLESTWVCRGSRLRLAAQYKQLLTLGQRGSMSMGVPCDGSRPMRKRCVPVLSLLLFLHLVA